MDTFSAETQKSGAIKEISVSSDSIIKYYNNLIGSGGSIKDLVIDPGDSKRKSKTRNSRPTNGRKQRSYNLKLQKKYQN